MKGTYHVDAGNAELVARLQPLQQLPATETDDLRH